MLPKHSAVSNGSPSNSNKPVMPRSIKEVEMESKEQNKHECERSVGRKRAKEMKLKADRKNEKIC